MSRSGFLRVGSPIVNSNLRRLNPRLGCSGKFVTTQNQADVSERNSLTRAVCRFIGWILLGPNLSAGEEVKRSAK